MTNFDEYKNVVGEDARLRLVAGGAIEKLEPDPLLQPAILKLTNRLEKTPDGPWRDDDLDALNRLHDEQSELYVRLRARLTGWPVDMAKLDADLAARAEKEGPQPEAPPLPRLTFFNDLGEQPPPKPWLIKNVIARDETSSWFGPPGTGKSALALDLAIAAGCGRDWRGYRTKQRCGVVYFALERGDLIKRRLIAHKLRDGLTDVPIAVAGEVINLLDKKCVDLIVDSIRAAEDRFGVGAGLAIFDTYSKGIAAGGGDEDKAKDQNIVQANLRRVFDRGCHVHIAGIGHPGKDESKGERGSSARRADVDMQVQISGGEGTKTATVIKGNDQPEGLLTSFALEPFDFAPDEDGDPFRTFILSAEVPGERAQPARKLSARQSRAITALAEVTLAQGRAPPPDYQLPGDIKVVSAEAWQEELTRSNVLDGAGNNPWARFKELRNALADRALIGTRDDLVWLPRPPGPYR